VLTKILAASEKTQAKKKEKVKGYTCTCGGYHEYDSPSSEGSDAE